MLTDAAAFYFSLTPGPGRQPIVLPTGAMGYIRVEHHPLVARLLDAHDNAHAKPGEVLMNTHYITKGA